MLGPRVLCTEIPRPLAPTGSFPEERFLGAVALKIPHRLAAAEQVQRIDFRFQAADRLPTFGSFTSDFHLSIQHR